MNLLEGFDNNDLEFVLERQISVDEYAAKIGTDDEIVTVTFVVNNYDAGVDLTNWFERGYDYVLDAEVSEGEITSGRYAVFVEVKRRTDTPNQIVELLADLEVLTNAPQSAWKIKIGDEVIEANIDELKARLILSPQAYREQHGTEADVELNEMRANAGLDVKPLGAVEQTPFIKSLKNLAGI